MAAAEAAVATEDAAAVAAAVVAVLRAPTLPLWVEADVGRFYSGAGLT